MATTWMRPLHKRKGKTILSSLGERTDYAKNPEKTEQGSLIIGYACDPRSVDSEFLLAKSEYEKNTGRNQGRRNVIAYHIRQSFKPGEITPQEAQEVAYELAMRFTKGKHAFIVAVHTDRKHIHCHTVFNSTALDKLHKFNNFWGSSFAIRRLSDIICAEHGLSIVENPKPSKWLKNNEWVTNEKPRTWNETIRQKIDEVLPSCTSFDGFLNALKTAGYTVKKNRKNISVCAPGQKRPSRLNTLGGEYTEAAIRARLGMKKTITSSGDSGIKTHVSLLVDIQAKIQEGKGPGYAQWAKIFNLKEAAKTLIFLKENGIDSYDDLKEKSTVASGKFAKITNRMKEIEARQKEISELQKSIGTYGKTREIYAKYKGTGWSRSFYDIHRADIVLHRAAKKHFDELRLKKLPTINQLRQEYSKLTNERKTLYGDYHKLKKTSRDLAVACNNAERILSITSDAQNRNIRSTKNRQFSHDL